MASKSPQTPTNEVTGEVTSPFHDLLDSPCAVRTSPVLLSPELHQRIGNETSPTRADSSSPNAPRQTTTPITATTATATTTTTTTAATTATTAKQDASATLSRPVSPILVPGSPVGSAPGSSSNGSVSANTPQQFCLRWNNYQSNLTSVFDQLLQNESFVDVTLACDGRSIKAHKMVLSACSPYFQTLFNDTPCQHPIVIMRDVCWSDLKAIVEFMYKGEINVSQDQIGPLLRIAEMLKVRGLADVTSMESAQDRFSMISPKDRTVCRTETSALETEDLLAFLEPEKKLRLSRANDWDFDAIVGERIGTSTSSNLELRLSPVQHQQLAAPRNVRKRRWPSADMIFNPPSSPLSGLIAAERAEQEKERERLRERDRECGREREREREQARDCSLMTPPISNTTSNSANPTQIGSGNTPRRLTPSVLETAMHLDVPPPATTPAPTSANTAAAARGSLTPIPHSMSSHVQQQQQSSHHHYHQQHHQHTSSAHHSQRTSPASSAASTHHPSSVISGPLTPSPASVQSSNVRGALEAAAASEQRFHQIGSAAQAAAMAAAAAAQMDVMGMSGGSHHHHSSIPTGSESSRMSQAPHHHTGSSLADDLEIKPGIAEMIREEERVSLIFVHSFS